MNNIWYFGWNAGVDFNSGSPVGIAGGQLFTTEGCASICDNAGQLLFYTDGNSVWDRSHVVMPNGTGLLGDGSSTQSAVICPDPGSPDKFYIFTADQGGYAGPNQGINYSLVDMTLNSGMGDVTLINQPLMAPDATEKIVAVRHCNGTDFWIIAHKFNSDAFHAYLLTATGVNLVPVISNVGTPHMNSLGYAETIGYMKASPDGTMLALATYTQAFAEYFDFDNLTGVVSNPVTITYQASMGGDGPYGVSFSPDNTKLYVSYFNYGAPTHVYQYDLLAGNPAAVIASEFAVQSDMQGTYGYAALQVGPDNKLYVSPLGAAWLDVINFPNLGGAACGYTVNAVPLPAGTVAQGGLPNNIDAFQSQGFLNIGPDTVICGSGSVVLDASGLQGTYLWSTGETTPTITVTQTGTYSVSVTSAVCSGVVTDQATVTFLSGGISLGPDVNTCNASVVLDPGVPGAQYLWSTGSAASSITVTQPGTYSVTVTTGACSFSDEVDVSFTPDAGIFPVNVFTPNGDGVNDGFTLGQFPADGYIVSIFDRWGVLVYESADPAQLWDGKHNGKDVPEGVYYWNAGYKNCTGELRAANGFVELLRAK
jgi:gliding motility-associated-like protein